MLNITDTAREHSLTHTKNERAAVYLPVVLQIALFGVAVLTRFGIGKVISRVVALCYVRVRKLNLEKAELLKRC